MPEYLDGRRQLMDSSLRPARTTRRAFLRRGSAAAALALGAPALLAACGDDEDGGATGGASGEGATTEVAVSLPAGGNSLSIWQPIVEQRRLSAPGVGFKWVGGDPGQLQTQFLAGSVDVSTFGAIGAALARLRGTDVAIVGPGIYAHHRWLVKDDSPYQSAADLRGRKVATGLATAEGFRLLELIAAIEGSRLEQDYDFVHTQGAAAVALFERDDVDAILIGEPNATILVSQGARQVDSVQDQWRAATGSGQPLFNAGATVRLDWARENARAARGAVRVLGEASTAIANDPALLEGVATSIGVKPGQDEVVGLLPERMGDVYTRDFGAPIRAQLDEIVALAVEHGIIPSRPRGHVYAALAS
jgi:NitT/TauT family transport system substrate-binding protein